MHMISRSDLTRARHNSKIERILYDYFGEAINHFDRRSYCLRQRFGHADYRPIFGRFTSRCTNKSMQVGKMWTDIRTWSQCRLKSPKRRRCSTWRPTAESFGRPKACCSRLAFNRSRKDWQKENLAALVKQFPKHLLLYRPARPSNKSDAPQW